MLVMVRVVPLLPLCKSQAFIAGLSGLAASNLIHRTTFPALDISGF